MIIVMCSGAGREDLNRVIRAVEAAGLTPHVRRRGQRLALGVTGRGDVRRLDSVRADPAVDDVIQIEAPYKLAARQLQPFDTVVEVGAGVAVGGSAVVLIAGPCCVESEPRLLDTACSLAAAGGHVLRASLVRPCTSPYSCRGLGPAGFGHLQTIRQLTGLPISTEVGEPAEVGPLSEVADILEIGAGSMQDFELLREMGRQPKPVILRRGPASTVEEWLLSAEYLLDGGNQGVILCETGFRGVERQRVLDLITVPLLEELTHLPVLVDLSYAAGRPSLLPAGARAALAAGADGIIVQVHSRPEETLCDGFPALTPARFADLVSKLSLIAGATHRSLTPPVVGKPAARARADAWQQVAARTPERSL